jgi:integrase
VTDFPAAAADYLALRRALGFELAQAERMLRDFTGYLADRGAERVTTRLALDWATRPARASRWWWRLRLGVVRGFARYLQAFDPATEVPPAGLISSPVPHVLPPPFSDAEIAALLDAAGALRPALRAATHQTLIGLLAATGMRIGEAIGLDDGDVDADRALITVRAAKYAGSRQLVIHPTAAAVLADYARTRDQHRPSPVCSAFFVSRNGARLAYPTVQRVFRQLTAQAGLASRDGRRPRMHDLRHSFAMTTLAGWHAAGLDTEALLPALATYLGHTAPAWSYWYLSASPDLLTQAARRLDTTAEGGP